MPVRKANRITLNKQSDMGLHSCFSGPFAEATSVRKTMNDKHL